MNHSIPYHHLDDILSPMTCPAITTTSTPGGPPSSNLHMGKLVPQVLYQSKTSKLDETSQVAPIWFVTQNMNGFPMRNALDAKYTGLVDRDDQIFSLQGPCSITLRILWPGYRPWERQVDYFSLLSRTNLDLLCVPQIRTRNWQSPPRPVTLAKLATDIAKSVKRFIDVRPRNLYFLLVAI